MHDTDYFIYFKLTILKMREMLFLTIIFIQIWPIKKSNVFHFIKN